MIPVETIPWMDIRGMEETGGGGDYKSEIFDIL
jgi:hypothetical protein